LGSLIDFWIVIRSNSVWLNGIFDEPFGCMKLMKWKVLSFEKARIFGYEINGLIEIEIEAKMLFAIFEKRKDIMWSKSN